MSKKSIQIDNPTNLPLIPLTAIQDFQGDLKIADPANIRKLAASILDHRLFVGKAVFYEDGVAYTEDGHQTLKALNMLVANGYKECDVTSYELVEGQMQPSGVAHYDYIVVPCQIIVPKGKTREARFKDAAEKLMQINSQYAAFNPQTSFFTGLNFSTDDLDQLLAATAVPDFAPLLKANDHPLSEYEQEFASHTDETAIYPIVRRYSESYNAIIIVVENDIDLTAVEEALSLGKTQSYKNNSFGTTHVISAEDFLKLWHTRL